MFLFPSFVHLGYFPVMQLLFKLKPFSYSGTADATRTELGSNVSFWCVPDAQAAQKRA
jgi:hypothetical protein